MPGRLYGVEYYNDTVVSNPAGQETDVYPLLSVDELFKMPPVQYLVDGEIPREGFTVYYGEPGCGKTFVALDRALTLAQKHTVIYVAGEGVNGYPDRIAAWCQRNELEKGNFHILTQSLSLLEEKDVSKLIRTIARASARVVFIDTLARVMLDGEENSAKDMGRLVYYCSEIQRQTEAAVVLIHHKGKGNGSRERGSSALRGAVDVMIEVGKDKELITLKCTKSKDAEPFPARCYYLEVVPARPGATSCVLAPPRSHKQETAQDQLTARHTAILDFLAKSENREQGARWSALKDAPSVGASNLNRALNRLKDKGYIKYNTSLKRYSISETGIKLVNAGKEKHS